MTIIRVFFNVQLLDVQLFDVWLLDVWLLDVWLFYVWLIDVWLIYVDLRDSVFIKMLTESCLGTMECCGHLIHTMVSFLMMSLSWTEGRNFGFKFWKKSRSFLWSFFTLCRCGFCWLDWKGFWRFVFIRRFHLYWIYKNGITVLFAYCDHLWTKYSRWYSLKPISWLLKPNDNVIWINLKVLKVLDFNSLEWTKIYVINLNSENIKQLMMISSEGVNVINFKMIILNGLPGVYQS